MNENIIHKMQKYNTPKPIFFTTTVDAGYYGKQQESPRMGAISVSVQLDMASFKRYAEKMLEFGFFIFVDIGSDAENIVYNDEQRQFINKNGTFNIVISEIPEDDFSKKICVIPFILISTETGEMRLFGDTVKVGVYEDKIRTADNLRWLGEKL